MDGRPAAHELGCEAQASSGILAAFSSGKLSRLSDLHVAATVHARPRIAEPIPGLCGVFGGDRRLASRDISRREWIRAAGIMDDTALVGGPRGCPVLVGTTSGNRRRCGRPVRCRVCGTCNNHRSGGHSSSGHPSGWTPGDYRPETHDSVHEGTNPVPRARDSDELGCPEPSCTDDCSLIVDSAPLKDGVAREAYTGPMPSQSELGQLWDETVECYPGASDVSSWGTVEHEDIGRVWPWDHVNKGVGGDCVLVVEGGTAPSNSHMGRLKNWRTCDRTFCDDTPWGSRSEGDLHCTVSFRPDHLALLLKTDTYQLTAYSTSDLLVRPWFCCRGPTVVKEGGHVRRIFSHLIRRTAEGETMISTTRDGRGIFMDCPIPFSCGDPIPAGMEKVSAKDVSWWQFYSEASLADDGPRYTVDELLVNVSRDGPAMPLRMRMEPSAALGVPLALRDPGLGGIPTTAMRLHIGETSLSGPIYIFQRDVEYGTTVVVIDVPTLKAREARGDRFHVVGRGPGAYLASPGQEYHPGLKKRRLVLGASEAVPDLETEFDICRAVVMEGERGRVSLTSIAQRLRVPPHTTLAYLSRSHLRPLLKSNGACAIRTEVADTPMGCDEHQFLPIWWYDYLVLTEPTSSGLRTRCGGTLIGTDYRHVGSTENPIEGATVLSLATVGAELSRYIMPELGRDVDG